MVEAAATELFVGYDLETREEDAITGVREAIEAALAVLADSGTADAPPEVTEEMVEAAKRALQGRWGKDEGVCDATVEEIRVVLRAALAAAHKEGK